MVFQINDQVYVSRTILGLNGNSPSPFYRTIIRQRNNRSVRVDLPNGNLSNEIATSKIVANFGVLIIRIGDFEEDGLLDPLAKSVLHYCRLLLPSDAVRLINLRTESELETLWASLHGMCQHVVIVSHGSADGIRFGNQWTTPERLREIFEAPRPEVKEFISLGCETGWAKFGKSFSQATCVSHFLAPFHSVHGCVASLFVQTFLNERILASKSTKVAFKHARADLQGAASFRLWHNGTLTAGPK
jgi:hypothetical protein